MSIYLRTRTDDVRALAGAIALGSSAGLLIGAVYLVGGAAGGRDSSPVATAPAADHRQTIGSPPLHSFASASARVDTGPPNLPVALRDRFGIATIAAQPFRFQRIANASSDLHCLTEAVYFEARGEAPAGQRAVAQVVLNRVRHPDFPKTICAVVHQRVGADCQFSFACGREAALEPAAWARAQHVASGALHGAVMAAVGDATHFQTASSSGALGGLMRVAQIGAHIFYRLGGREGAASMFHQAPKLSTPRVELARLDVSTSPVTVAPESTGDTTGAQTPPMDASSRAGDRSAAASNPVAAPTGSGARISVTLFTGSSAALNPASSAKPAAVPTQS